MKSWKLQYVYNIVHWKEVQSELFTLREVVTELSFNITLIWYIPQCKVNAFKNIFHTNCF